MYLGSHEGFDAALLSERIASALGRLGVADRWLDAGNGTPVADALATALQLDLRLSGRGRTDGMAVLDALTDVQIFEFAAYLSWTIAHENAKLELPLGTVLQTGKPGDIRIGEETWVLDAGRPGLHPMETTRRDAHGPNLELLHTYIRRYTRGLACRHIGLPNAIFIVDTDDRHLLQFPPFAKAGGVVLQRWGNGTDAPRFCGALPEQIRTFAKSIVSDMRVLWSRRIEIAACAAKIREHAEGVAAAHGASVLRVAVDLQHQHDDDDFSMYVHFEAVDEAMRKGAVLDFYQGSDVADRWVRGPYGVVARPADLPELRALGADGHIDDMAAAVASAAPGGTQAVLTQLASAYETTFELPTTDAPCYATLYWRDGTIKAEVTMEGRLDWCGDRLVLMNQLIPLTMVTSLPGRTVDAFAQLPFPCPLKVAEADINGLDLKLQLEVGEHLVNCRTGAIWADPNAER